MSDILIKGMEMPKEGNVYLIIGEDGVVSEKIGSMYHVTTEAIELPPHGDLIDKNELSIIGITDYKLEGHTVVEFEDVLNAPVILEATKKTDTPRKTHICPYYQGVCVLDEDIVCYCSSSYGMCDKYREANNGSDN